MRDLGNQDLRSWARLTESPGYSKLPQGKPARPTSLKTFQCGGCGHRFSGPESKGEINGREHCHDCYREATR